MLVLLLVKVVPNCNERCLHTLGTESHHDLQLHIFVRADGCLDTWLSECMVVQRDCQHTGCLYAGSLVT